MRKTPEPISAALLKPLKLAFAVLAIAALVWLFKLSDLTTRSLPPKPDSFSSANSMPALGASHSQARASEDIGPETSSASPVGIPSDPAKTAPPVANVYRVPVIDRGARSKTNAFVRRLRDVSWDQAAKDPEMLQLMERCNAFNDEKTKEKMEKAVTKLAEMTGRETGSLMMSFENFSDPFSLAVFEAAFANNREMFETVVLKRIEGAILEFSLDPTLEETSDGTTIEGKQTTSPAATIKD